MSAATISIVASVLDKIEAPMGSFICDVPALEKVAALIVALPAMEA